MGVLGTWYTLVHGEWTCYGSNSSLIQTISYHMDHLKPDPRCVYVSPGQMARILSTSLLLLLLLLLREAQLGLGLWNMPAWPGLVMISESEQVQVPARHVEPEHWGFNILYGESSVRIQAPIHTRFSSQDPPLCLASTCHRDL